MSYFQLTKDTPYLVREMTMLWGVYGEYFRENIYHNGTTRYWNLKKMVTILQTTSWIFFFFNENIVIPIKIVLKNVPESAVDSTGAGNGLLQTGE